MVVTNFESFWKRKLPKIVSFSLISTTYAGAKGSNLLVTNAGHNGVTCRWSHPSRLTRSVGPKTGSNDAV